MENQEQSQSTLSRIIGIFTSPKETLEDIARNPSWIVPIVLVTASALTFMYLLSDIFLDLQLAAIEEQGQEMSAAQIEQMQSISGVVMLIMAAIMPTLSALIVAGLYLFTGKYMFGGESNYKTLFSLVAWSAVVTILSVVINTPFVLNAGEFRTLTGLVGLSGQMGQQWTSVLGELDLINIWMLVLRGLGVAAAFGFSVGRGMTISFGWWAVYVLILAGFASMS